MKKKKRPFRLTFHKFYKLFIALRYGFYYVTKKNIGSYTEPPEKPNFIGYFDKKGKVNVLPEHASKFRDNTINFNDESLIFKKDVVNLVEIEDKIMVEKKYSGRFKYYKFYNEIIALDKLSNLRISPKLLYIDYINLISYIEFIDGTTIKSIIDDNRIVSFKDSIYYEKFILNLKKIHNNNIIVVDIGKRNAIINNNKIYFIDFVDSIPYQKYFIKIPVLGKKIESLIRSDYIRAENF